MELRSFETFCSTWNVHPYPYFLLQSTRVSKKSSPRPERCNGARALSIDLTSHQARLPSFSMKCHQNEESPVSNADTYKSIAVEEEAVLLKKKAQEIIPDLKGTCIFIVGMAGSGKSTVGRTLAEVLGYYFFDSDELVEQAAGGASVAEKLRKEDEEGFRDSESEVLKQLSSMGRLVVSTGDGAVLRSKNLSCMRHGIIVWLDVPLEALAKYAVAEGTDSQPLFGKTTAESYPQALARLTKLFEERGEGYAIADTKISLQKIATERGYEDVFALTPSVIAIEVLKAINKLVRYKKLMKAATEPCISKQT